MSRATKYYEENYTNKNVARCATYTKNVNRIYGLE